MLKVLNGLSLTIFKDLGQKVAVHGLMSGSGKSTWDLVKG